MSTLAGSLILVGIVVPSGSTVTSVIDNLSQTYTKSADFNEATNSASHLYIYCFTNAAAGVGAITITCSAGTTNVDSFAAEYTGAVTSSAANVFDTSATGTHSSNAGPATAAITTNSAVNGYLLFSVGSAGSGGNFNFSGAGGGNAFFTDNANLTDGCGDQYGANGTYNPTLTWTGGNQGWAFLCASFKAAASTTSAPCVQGCSYDAVIGTNVTSLTIHTLPSTAGDLMCFAMVMEPATISAITVTDNKSQSYSSAINASLATTPAMRAILFYFPNTVAGVTSITASWTTASGGVAWAAEFSGVKTTSPLDKTATGAGNSITTWATASSGTLTQASEVIVAVGANANAGTITLSPGSTPAYATIATTKNAGILEFVKVNATTAVTGNGTGTSANYISMLATFLNAAVASGGVPNSLMMTGCGS